MTRVLSWASLTLLIVALSSIALPELYHIAFAPDVEPTHMFYSPLERDFVFREHRGNHDFSYASAGGKTYDRQTFEATLPFIYYRNMAQWGLLPITIDGRTFDKDTIRDTRQVFELKSRELADRHPGIPVYALLDSTPGRAGLAFPEDVFRMREDRMEFINVDVNRVDPELTGRFTSALLAAGFSFPAQMVAGKQTILKPFDEGVFLVDATGSLFHVKRNGEMPWISRTSVPSDLGIRTIKVTENEQRRFVALVLGGDGRIFLLRSGSYEIVPLPTEGYDPDSMDYKLLVNPVAPTAIYGNDNVVQAVAMRRDFVPFASYRRDVPGTRGQMHDRIAQALFPFTLDLLGSGSYLRWNLALGGWISLVGNLLATIVMLFVGRRARVSWRSLSGPVFLTLLAGVYGLFAVLLAPFPFHPKRHAPE